jgi:hypothetical protein
MLRQLLQIISHTREEEIDCDEVYSVIDQYAEAIARGEDPTKILPLVKHHLEICQPCLEEYEALLRVITESSR